MKKVIRPHCGTSLFQVLIFAIFKLECFPIRPKNVPCKMLFHWGNCRNKPHMQNLVDAIYLKRLLTKIKR